LVINSLCFITNAKNYGPFGSKDGGTPFSFVMKEGGAIEGFQGRCGAYLDAIGVYLQKLTSPASAQEPEDETIEPNEPMVEEIIEIHDVCCDYSLVYLITSTSLIEIPFIKQLIYVTLLTPYIGIRKGK